MLLAGLLLFAGNLNAETVRLQWDSNTEPDLATGSKPRYKIYVRDGQSLQGNKANATSVWSVLVADDEDPRAEYVLRTISLDRLSFVAVTAIDEAGNESGLSNEVFWPKTGPALATKGSLSWVEKEPHVAITFSRAQTTKSADGANPTATFDSTPSEGNLIVAACFSRSGNSTTTHSISGSGWTKRIARDTQLADSSYRRSISVWTKAAGASEATAIQISGDTVRLVIQEFTAGESGATWTFEDSVDNDNGATANATTIATGTTDSIGAGDLLLIGIGGSKCGPDTSQQSFSWDNLGEAQSFDTTDSYTRMVGVAFGQESASGTRTSTATLGGGATANSGLSAAIIVFKLVASGGESVYLEGTISISTSTPDADIITPAVLTGQAQITTGAPDADLTVLRTLSSLTEIVTSTPDADLITPAILSGLSQISTSTPDALLTVARSLSAAIDSTTSTPDALLQVGGMIQANILIQTSTPDIGLIVARSLHSNSSIVTVTPDAILQVGTALLASILIQTVTQDADYVVPRELTGLTEIITSTPDADYIVPRELLANVPISTATADAALQVARSLIASIQAGTSTQDALLTIAKSLLADIIVATSTPDCDLTIPVLGNSLAANILLQTSTLDAGLTVPRTLASGMIVDTITADAVLQVARSLIAGVNVTTSTQDAAALLVATLLSGSINIITDTQDANYIVPRELLAGINIASLTADASLLLIDGDAIYIIAPDEFLTTIGSNSFSITTIGVNSFVMTAGTTEFNQS